MVSKGKNLKLGVISHPPRKLICRGKKLNLKRGGGGNDQNVQYLSLIKYV